MPSPARRDGPAGLVTYQLLIRVDRPRRVRVGRLGTFVFPAGRYVYTGSARRALQARVARHLSGAKRLYWHIDYLLASRGVAIESVRRSRTPECEANRAAGGTAPAPGFGASDCRFGCGSHLRFLGSLPASAGKTGTISHPAKGSG